jgi:hypothetical protein
MNAKTGKSHKVGGLCNELIKLCYKLSLSKMPCHNVKVSDLVCGQELWKTMSHCLLNQVFSKTH